jgi:hypothetical protein
MKYLKSFNEGYNNSDDIEKGLNRTKDLWEVDKIGAELENLRGGVPGDGPDRGFYNSFHSVLVPNWIKKHWNRGMLYNGVSLSEQLDDCRKVFYRYLDKEGYKYDNECYVGYEVCAEVEDEDEEFKQPAEGVFKMAFNISIKKLNKRNEYETVEGWACFLFKMPRWGSLSVTEPVGLKPIYVDENIARVIIELGKGTFYSYKISSYENPYGNLAEYFTDGGYMLASN